MAAVQSSWNTGLIKAVMLDYAVTMPNITIEMGAGYYSDAKLKVVIVGNQLKIL